MVPPGGVVRILNPVVVKVPIVVQAHRFVGIDPNGIAVVVQQGCAGGLVSKDVFAGVELDFQKVEIQLVGVVVVVVGSSSSSSSIGSLSLFLLFVFAPAFTPTVTPTTTITTTTTFSFSLSFSLHLWWWWCCFQFQLSFQQPTNLV